MKKLEIRFSENKISGIPSVVPIEVFWRLAQQFLTANQSTVPFELQNLFATIDESLRQPVPRQQP